MAAFTLPSALYYTSAALHAITVPKHTLVGINKITPAAATISDKYALQRKLIPPTWFHSNTWLIATALLNVMWAQNGGPRNVFERSIVWLQFAMGAVVGWPYLASEMYAGLPMLWGGSACTLVAMLWES